jgi:predicted ester cyclase
MLGPTEAPVDSLERNKAVVRRFLEEVVNTGDTARLADFISEACVETDGLLRVPSGIPGMAAHVAGVRAVYPDLRVTVERQIAEGDWVATVLTARGTHRGPWLGMAPTGKPLVFTGVNINRVVEGRIVEHGGAANMLGPFLEAGSLAPVGAPGAEP